MTKFEEQLTINMDAYKKAKKVNNELLKKVKDRMENIISFIVK